MFKILDEVCTPIRSTKYSAYIDLFAREDVVIGAGETKVIPLGVKIDIQKIDEYILSTIPYGAEESLVKKTSEFMSSHYLEVALRSSLAVKGLIISNGIGVIDLDYPDEIGLIIHYSIDSHILSDLTRGRLNEYNIKKGDKVAQCTLKEHKGYLMGYESDTIRDGGFGSTEQQ